MVEFALFDVEEPFVEPVRMVADPQPCLDHRVVHRDQRAGRLDPDERPDGLDGGQPGHAEIGLAERDVVLGAEAEVGAGRGPHGARTMVSDGAMGPPHLVNPGVRAQRSRRTYNLLGHGTRSG